ncbi:MAG: ester cyclase [Caldilineales bacterium]|nr:ester cyclase [Caldilineales bacterium]MCW5858110.1 ester cyclase [Caldilineales bacterium]
MNAFLPHPLNSLIDAWNAHDSERVSSFYAADFVGVDLSQSQLVLEGMAGLHRLLASAWRAFPDLELIPEEMIVDCDRIAVFWLVQGTHQGRLLNIPPTGRKVQWRGVSWLTWRDDKIEKATYLWDLAGLLRSLGLLPDL